MKILPAIIDYKIEAVNILIEITIGEYLQVAKPILDNNEFQRRRVIKSTVSRQLKADLQVGCTIPPIILAIENDVLPKDFNYKTALNEKTFNLKTVLTSAFREKKLLIIDGLQRTNVLLDLQKDLQNNEEELKKYHQQSIRAEIYVGIDKLGILYRMITLNSGQQTMSLRHLVEILYSDYRDEKFGNNIKLYTQRDNITVPQTSNDFGFKDIIDGFNAYITEAEQPLNKISVLDNIQNIKRLSKIRENQKDVFTNFILSYQKMLKTMERLSNNWLYKEEEISNEFKLTNRPFGTTALNIFKKSQVIFGFGVALRTAVEFTGKDIEGINEEMEKIEFNDNVTTAFSLLLKRLDEIRNSSKISIGAAQRVFFKYFFAALLMPNPYNRNIYLNFDNAVEEGMQQTSRELNFKIDRQNNKARA